LYVHTLTIDVVCTHVDYWRCMYTRWLLMLYVHALTI